MIRVKDIRSGKSGGEERAKSSLFSISDIRNPSGDVRMNQQQEYANAMKSSRLREVAQVKEEKKSSQAFADKLKVTQGLMSGKKVPAASAEPKVDVPANNPLTTVLQTRETLKKASKVTGNAPTRYESEPPVIRDIHRGLDWLAEKTKPVADIGKELYTPSATANVVTAATRGAGNLISKLVPGLGRTLGGRVAKTAATEALVGAPLGIGNQLAKNPESTPGELLTAGGYGAGGGAAVGAMRPLIRAGLQKGTQVVGDAFQGVRGALEASAQPSVLPSTARRIVAQDVHVPTDVPKLRTDTFTKLFGEQNLGITPFASKKSNRMVTTEQQIVNNPLKSNIKGVGQNVKQGVKSAYDHTVDILNPLKKINKQTYDTAMDANRANNMANTIIRDKFVDNEGNVIGNSLNDIMKQTRGLGKKFDDYLLLRHAETRMKRGERVYDDALQMTPEKAREAALRLEARYPGLKEIGDAWDNFNGNILDSGVREGLISQVARDAMRAENPHYASMRRQFSVGERLAQPKWGNGGSSFSGQKAPIKQVSPTGSTRKIVSPLRSAVEQVYAWKNAELRNRTMQEIVKEIQANPQGMQGIAEIVKKPSTSYKSLDEALRDGGSEEFLELLDNDFKTLFKKNAAGDENIVRAMVNGNPVYVKVHNSEAVKALLGLGSQESGIVMRAMQLLSNATKRGATGVLAPMFAVKSLTADVVQAAIQSPDPLKHVVVDLPHAILSSLADMLPGKLKIPGLKNLAEDFRRAGGEYSALLRGDRQLNRSVYQLRREAPFTPQGMVKGAYNVGRGVLKGFEKIADTSENVNRMASYRRSMVGKERSAENVRNAINASREATVNFSRKGAWGKEVEAFIPYSNAAVQSIYRVAKNFTNPKTALTTLAGVSALVVGPKLYEYSKFNNDPDYQKIPARVRYRNLIHSKNADGTFNMVPMPPEYMAIGAFMTDVLNNVVNKDPEAYKGTFDALANAYTPPLISGALQGYTQGGGPLESFKGAANATVFAPIQAITGNQSFTGAPIVPKRLENASPRNQYDERTSSPSKWIGKKLGLAPLQVDYLLRSYGGDASRLLLPLTSNVGGGTARNTLLKNFIVDPVFTNTLSDDFYTAKKRLANAQTDHGDFGDPLPKWYSEDIDKLVNSQAKGSASKRLSALNATLRELRADKTLSAQVKAQKLRDTQAEINQIYLEVNTKLRQAGVPMPNR